jgi:4-hydroxy-2-oxoheptanedioate aldolase
MGSTPLRDDFEAGRTSLGVWVQSPEMVELCGHVGFRWVMLDQMFSANDWGRLENLIRAADAAEVTPVVRVQSNPWLGYDHRVSVDVARAVGVGAEFVLVSHSNLVELDECVAAAGDWHRRALNLHPYAAPGTLMPRMVGRTDPTWLIPQPETGPTLEALPEVMARPGVHAVFIGMSDAARALAGDAAPDFYDPRLWEYVDRAVELGRRHGVIVGANTSYGYTLDDLRRRVEMLHEHGVRMIMIQGASFLFQVAANQLLGELAPLLR